MKKLLAMALLRILRVNVSVAADAVAALRAGHAIVCANHVSLLDGVLIALISPAPLTFAVDTAFSRRSRLAIAGMALMARMGYGKGVVPLDSGSSFGLRRLKNLLDAGESVMLFPEGEISPDGRRRAAQPGLEWLLKRTGARVVEVHISGAEKSWLFAKAGTELLPRIELEVSLQARVLGVLPVKRQVRKPATLCVASAN